MPSSRFTSPIRPIAAAMLSLVAAWAQAVPLAIDLPAQPLSTSIQQLSRQSGLSIGGNAALLEGKAAPAVKGAMEPLVALNRLLAGSGLEAITAADGSLVVRNGSVATLAEVSVMAAAAPDEGSAQAGYRPETAKATGPWGDKPIQDTPYSVHSVPAELMENMIAPSADRLLLYIPTASPGGNTANNGGYLNVGIRGFTNVEITRNGIPMRWTWLSTSTEDLERMETLSGSSGFLYGAGNVGGVTNLVSKRPTPYPVHDLTLGNYGNGQWYAHADLGGPIGEDERFGYRLNVLTQDGETMMRGQRNARNMLSGALDWHLSRDLLVQFDASHETRNVNKPDNYLFIWGASAYPSAKDVDNRRLFTNDGTYSDLTARRLGTNLTWSPSDALAVRAGYLRVWETQDYKTATYWIDDVGGAYIDSAKLVGSKSWSDGGYLYADLKFRALGINHKLTFGMNTSAMEVHPYKDGYNWQEFYFPDLATALNSPEVTWPELGQQGRYVSMRQRYTNTLVGDDIAFNERWSALVGINHASIKAYAYNTSETATSSYDSAATTPTVSLIFKPRPDLSLYATYMRSLQSGMQVATGASPPYTNAGQFLPPTIGKQIEIGAKATLGSMLLTAALYQIDQANLYDDNHDDGTRTRTQDGRQVHRGIELTASGKATKNLTLFGGASFIDAKITKTNLARDQDNAPTFVPKAKLSLYAEYALPFLRSLYLTGGASYRSSVEYVPALKDYRATSPGYAVADLGLRYETRLYDKPAIFRLGISNLFDKHYYINVGPALGAPRTVAFSTTLKF